MKKSNILQIILSAAEFSFVAVFLVSGWQSDRALDKSGIKKKGDASPIKRKVGNLNGGMQLENDLNVFKCANKRYRQTVASDFFISNKVITYAAIISVLLLFLGSGTAVNLGKAIGLSALFFAIHRRALYLGFYDGYEQGYTDTIEKPNNLHTFTDTESEIYWQDKEIEGNKKNRFI